MEIQLLRYSNYKDYLRERIDAEPGSRGLRLKISAFIGCQPSYFSQVLNGKPNLTLEQASHLNQFFHHNLVEERYFILLVELSRAGSVDLKNHFQKQIEEIQQAQFDLKKRLKNTEDLPENARTRYYSTWFYSAIHVALSVPELQSTTKLAALYNLPLSLVSEVVDFLEESGLIENIEGRFVLTKRRIHLDRDSEFIQRHHINWRSQALQSAEKNLPENLQYSNVIAIAESDFVKIKEILIKSIEDARKVVAPSNEECVYALTMDFFKL